MMFLVLGVLSADPHNPRVEDEVASTLLLASVKSPKSIVFPVDAIVRYCMTLYLVYEGAGPLPPPKTPLVPVEHPPPNYID